ncbi:MAG: trypsin-like peptidase domain-containing protein [Lachnospiraceae bacterium]|nr:trypsin-like peptidase domain-containing protein [Lachnospiraceae bacterium]
MKKIMMLFIVITMLWCMPHSVASAEEKGAGNLENMLYYTDAKTGATQLISMDVTNVKQDTNGERISAGNMTSPSGILTGRGSFASSTRAIIGDDNMWKVADASAKPYSAIGLVEVTYTNGRSLHGTGFMISGNTMLTAAHNIIEKDWEVANVAVYLRKSKYYRTPTAYASSWYVCAEYNDYLEVDHKDDYAILCFSSDISNYWFGLDTSVTYNPDAYLCGYPYDKANVTTRTFEQWCANGTIVSHGYEISEHNIDSKRGQSGGPIFLYNSTLKQWVVRGIHVGDVVEEEGDDVGYRCFSRRITDELFDFLVEKGFISE